MQDAIEALAGPRPAHGLTPAVLVGLCSGAYQALDSGIDLWTTGCIAVNPVLRFPPPEAKNGTLHPRRTLARPVDESLREAYNKLPDWKVLRLARKGYMAASRLRARQKTAIWWLSEMSSRGTDVLCICGRQEADALFEGSPPRSAPSCWARTPKSRSSRISTTGSFPSATARQVGDLMTRHLVSGYLHDTDAAPAPDRGAMDSVG